MNESLNKRTLVSNALWKFAERIGAQLVSLVVSIVLARILFPEDYGAVSVVLIFITVANVLVSEGLTTSLIQKKDSDEKDFSSVFYFNLGLSVVFYLLLFFTSPLIASFFDISILTPVLRVLGVQIIITAFKSVIHSYVAKNFLFKKYFFATFFGTLISGVVGIIMALNGCGVWSLVAQYLINSVIDTIILWIVVKWRPILYFSFRRVSKLVSFGWKVLLESLSSTIVGEIRSVIIGRVYTSSDLAYYEKGHQFPKVITTNICSSVGSVLFPAVSHIQDEDEKVVMLLRKTIRLTSFIVFPMLTGLAVTAPRLVQVVLTDKWISAVPYLQIACFTFALQVGMIPRHQALNGIGRSDVFLIENTIARIVGLVLLLLVYKHSVLAIALTSIVSASLLTIIVFITSKKYNHYRIKDQIMDILPILLGCLLFGVPVYMLGFIDLNIYIVFALQVFLGVFIYVLYSVLTKNEEFRFCISFIKGIFKKEKAK